MHRNAFLATLALTVACSDNNIGPSADPGSIQLALSTGAVTIAPSGNASVIVTLTRAGAFTGDVTLAVSGLPAGITPVVTPQTLSSATSTATITLAVSAATTPGNYAVIVTGTGAGVSQASGTFQITVSAAPAFAISVPGGGLNITTSNIGTLNIAIQRTNFNGPIDLTLLNPPAGVTTTITPASTTGIAALLTLIVSPTATPRIIPLILRGSAQGLPDRTVQFDLTISTPVVGNRVEYQFCDPLAAPVFFAYQDGAGAWQPVTGVAQSGTVRFAFDIASGRGGVAMVFATSTSEALARSKVGMRRPLVAARMQAAARRYRVDAYETFVSYASTAEFVEDGIETCAATQPSKTANATVAGVPIGSYGILSFGNTTEIYNPATDPSGSITFGDVPNGPNDFVGVRTTPGNPPDRIILMRDLNIPDNGFLPSINFNTPALTPATAPVTVTGGFNDLYETFVDLVTANNRLGLWFELSSSPATARTWAGLRQQDMLSSDFHGLIVFASPQSQNGDFRVTLKYVDFVSNQTLALGAPISLPNITQIPASNRLRFQGVLPSDYDRGVGFTVAPDSGFGNFFYVTATAGYLAALGNAFTYNVSMPDLSALTGFPTGSLAGPGDYSVAVDAYGFNGPGVFDLRPVRGGLFRAAVRNTSTTIQ